jgi:parallel beta-helix repeat protein
LILNPVSLRARHPAIVVPCLLLSLTWIFTPSPARSKTLTVGHDGAGEYATIQSAIDAAAMRDTVLVLPGRYVETLSIVGTDVRPITVRLISAAGPASTIIDGGGSGPVIRCLYVSQDSSIEGFTITGGVTGRPLAGGGIYLVADASPLIRGNVVTGNRAQYGGGALSDATKPPAPRAPQYCEPESGSGGGVYVHYLCTPEIIDNTIADNEASGNGGGVVFWDHANAHMQGNRVYRNAAGRNGGGVYVGCNASPTLEGNILAWNKAIAGGGVLMSGFEADAVVVRNTLYMNSASSGAGGIQCKGQCVPVITANLIGVAAGAGVLCDPETDATVSCNVVWGVDGEDFDGDCFPVGVEYGDLRNVVDEIEFCGAHAADFRPCTRPWSLACGQVGAVEGACPPGACGYTRGSWGLLKSLYRDP